ncbi:MAG: insulinase family protein, partial [Muribaculaceae bacterium]|nr:insulinase family protein [Muribaculaceae bacterium]
AYVDQTKEEPLIPNLPKPGKIKKEAHNAQWDATEFTLSNGVKVLVKTTKFKEDEILFNATAIGGTSKLPDSNATDLKGMEIILSQNGLGDYTYSDLQKYLSGKQVAVGISFDDYVRKIQGHSTPKDLPTLMELIYMTFTNINITEDEFKALQNQYAGILANQENTPQFIFSRDLMKSLFANPRRQMVTSEDILALNRDNILKIAHDMTLNAADYDFVFVGNIDMDAIRPLLEQYIATLPANAKKVNNKVEINPTLSIKDGKGIDSFTTKMETPQTYVFFAQAGELPYSAKERALASIAGQVLGNRLLKTVREDMGAVYSIGASGSMSRFPGKNTVIQSSFPMKPEMKAEVLNVIDNEIAAMATNVTADEVNKCLEFMIKEAKEGKELNDEWLDAISNTRINGVDIFNGNVEMLQGITPDDVMKFMKNLRKADNYRIVVLDPAE